ncbi:MAG: hypothetical protein RMK17_02580 [bacterium]|nr:hypothetical protein [bacterium]
MKFEDFNKKNFIYFFILILVSFLQIKINLFLNYNFNFLLSLLILFVFFIDYIYLIFFSLIGIILINWEPKVNLEIILLFLIPQLFYLISKKVGFKNWLMFTISLVIGFSLFYIVLDYTFILKNPLYFLYDILINILFGLTLFYYFQKIK